MCLFMHVKTNLYDYVAGTVPGAEEIQLREYLGPTENEINTWVMPTHCDDALLGGKHFPNVRG